MFRSDRRRAWRPPRAGGGRYAVAMPGDPPRDPDEWTDEQWLAWLDEGVEEDDDPPSVSGRLQRSSGGQVLGNAMLGIAQAMYGTVRPEVVVEAPAPGDPHDAELDVRLDPDHPERSVVVRRPGRRQRGRPGAP